MKVNRIIFNLLTEKGHKGILPFLLRRAQLEASFSGRHVAQSAELGGTSNTKNKKLGEVAGPDTQPGKARTGRAGSGYDGAATRTSGDTTESTRTRSRNRR